MSKRNQAEIITFKADKSLLAALDGVSNRSEFIRSAVMAALENVCPLCKGRGLLHPDQKSHWQAFAESHRVSECDDCHAWHLTCPSSPPQDVHRAAAPSRHRTPKRSRRGGASE